MGAERVHRKICIERTKWAKKQVDEAAQLLQRQVEEATNHHQQLLLVAKNREGALAKQLASMTLHVQKLETQCWKAGVAVNRLPLEHDEAFAHTIAEHCFLKIGLPEDTFQDQKHFDTSEYRHTVQHCEFDSLSNKSELIRACWDNEIIQAETPPAYLSDLGER